MSSFLGGPAFHGQLLTRRVGRPAALSHQTHVWHTSLLTWGGQSHEPHRPIVSRDLGASYAACCQAWMCHLTWSWHSKQQTKQLLLIHLSCFIYLSCLCYISGNFLLNHQPLFNQQQTGREVSPMSSSAAGTPGVSSARCTAEKGTKLWEPPSRASPHSDTAMSDAINCWEGWFC